MPVLGRKERALLAVWKWRAAFLYRGERVLCVPGTYCSRRTLPFTWNCISPVECGSAVLGTLTKGNVNHPKGQEACIHDCAGTEEIEQWANSL